MRADAMLEAGGLDGYAVWKLILRAIEELQGTEGRGDVHMARVGIIKLECKK